MSYFDHPSAVAILIRLSTAVFGTNPFGIRFFSTVIATTIIVSLSTLVPKKRLITYALFTPLFLWASVLMTPDSPFLLFWTLYFLWTLSVAKRLTEWGDDPISRVYRSSPVSMPQWCLGGMLLGLGLNSKYTMAFAPLCLLITLFRFRRTAWAKGFLTHALVALILFVPVVVFNYQHQFAPFLFQWNHGVVSDTQTFRFFTEFVLAQILLVGLMPVWINLWQLLRLREIFDYPILKVSSIFFTVPFFFFLFQSMRGKVEGNWALMAFISFWPLAQLLLDNSSFRRETGFLVLGSFIPCFLISLLMAVHLVIPLKFITPGQDRVGRLREQQKVMKTIAIDISKDPIPIYATTYQNVAQLRYQAVPAEQLVGFGRASQFTFQPVNPCDFSRLLVLQETAEMAGPLACFRTTSVLKEYAVNLRSQTVHRYYLVQYTQ